MIWFGSKLGIKFTDSHNSFINWLIYVITNLKAEDLIHIAAITYRIWFARNKCVFEFRNLADSIVINKANNNMKEYQHAANSELLTTTTPNDAKAISNVNHRRIYSTGPKRWSKPKTSIIKVNCDANLAKPGRWGWVQLIGILTVSSLPPLLGRFWGWTIRLLLKLPRSIKLSTLLWSVASGKS
jgi:hypothetical protein